MARTTDELEPVQHQEHERLHVHARPATTTNGVDAYRIGVAVGAQAVRRAPSTPLAGLAVSGAYSGLTDGNDTAAMSRRRSRRSAFSCRSTKR